MNLLACAGFEMNALKSHEAAMRGAPLSRREFKGKSWTTSSPPTLPVFVTVTSALTGSPALVACVRGHGGHFVAELWCS